MSSAMKVGAAVTAAVLLVLAVGFRARTPPAVKAAAAAREDRAVPAATSASTASVEARLARDRMRDRILETLRRHDAGAPPAPARAARDVVPASRPAPPPAADEGARGKYDPAYIRQVFREDMFPLLRQCYADALLRQPELGGRLVLTFTIVGDASVGGVVEDADFADESDIKNEEMRTCTRESLMTLTFDKPPSGGGYVTVKYPVLFAPGDDPGDAGGR